MLKKEARKITGGLSAPNKMPGPSINLPAWNCITGLKLQAVKNSVCAGCYAMKGRYRFPNVREAMDKRLAALADPRWVDAMVTLISGEPFFRWHDSGDIQSIEHLENIESISYTEFKSLAERPLNSSLSSDKIFKTFNISSPNWYEELELAISKLSS